MVPADPMFRVPLSIEQRNLVPLSAEVAVTFPEGVWSGRVDRAVESPEFGQLDLIVTARDGGLLCGEPLCPVGGFREADRFPGLILW